MPGGGERVTLVTEKRIGYTNFSPWTADDPADDVLADYTVVELVLDGADSGQGTMSLAADVGIDGGSGRVSLDSGGREPLLTAVRLAPKPYWATAD